MTLRSERDETIGDGSSPSRLIIVVVGLIALLAAAYTAYLWGQFLLEIGTAGLPGSNAGPDFRTFSVAGSLVRAGNVADLYNPSAVSYEVADAAPFVYPSWFAISMIPLSAMGFQAGYWTWLGVTAAFAAGSLAKLQRRIGVVAFLIAVIGPAGFKTVLPGQSAFLMLGLGAIIAWAMVNRHDRTAGVVAGLMAFKPHMVLGLGFVWLLRWKRSGTSIVSAVVAAVILYGGSELLLPGSLAGWISLVTDSSVELVHPWAEITLGAAARLLLGEGSVATAVTALVVIGGVAWLASVIHRRVVDDGTLLLAAFGVAAVVSLHALLYDVFVIVPALVLVWQARPRLHTDMALYGIATLSLLTINPFIVSAQLDMFDRAIAIGPIALAVFVVWLVEATSLDRRSTPSTGIDQLDSVDRQ